MTPVGASEFRRVLGHLATGVTVVTAGRPGATVGMAANSVTAVSLTPPLVLFCPAATSTTWPLIRTGRMFCLNLMARHHEQATRRFSHRDVDRFAGVGWEAGPAGPRLTDALGWVDCRIRDEHEAGDHTIVVADVLSLEAAQDGEPLLFFQGRYGTFFPHPPPRAPG